MRAVCSWWHGKHCAVDPLPLPKRKLVSNCMHELQINPSFEQHMRSGSGKFGNEGGEEEVVARAVAKLSVKPKEFATMTTWCIGCGGGCTFLREGEANKVVKRTVVTMPAGISYYSRFSSARSASSPL